MIGLPEKRTCGSIKPTPLEKVRMGKDKRYAYTRIDQHDSWYDLCV